MRIERRIMINKDTENGKVHVLSVTVIAIIFIVTFLVRGYGMYPDSYSYIAACEAAEPLYPLLLMFSRKIFGEGLYLWAVAFGEMVLALYATWRFSYEISKRYRLKQWSIIAVYCILLAYFLVPAVFSVSHLIIYLAILTEGITYPLFLLWFTNVIATVLDASWKKWCITLGITFILLLTRPAMLPLIVFVFVLGIYLVIKSKTDLRKIVLVGLTCVAIYGLLLVCENIYFKVLTGHWSTHTSGAVTAMADVLYVCDDEDEKLFDNPEIRKIFADTVSDMRANEYGYMYSSGNDMMSLAAHMEYCHDYIKMNCYLGAVNPYLDANGVNDNFERLKAQDQIASQITKPLFKAHFGRWLKCYIGNCFVGLIRTVATAPSSWLMRIYTAIVLMFTIAGLIRYRKRKEIAEFVIFAWLSVAAIVASTSMVIMCLQRYMLYNFPLVYTGIIIMMNDWKNGVII